MNPFSLEGKTILVTGASSGIGKATAIACSQLGGQVIITGRNADRLNETYQALEGNGHLQFVADLATRDGVDSIAAAIPALDGLVNNAGISNTRPIAFMNEDDLNCVFGTNLFSPMLLTQALLQSKKLKKGGSIVFTSSMAALNPEMGNSIYGASKAALKTFMLGCAKELASKKIRANAVHPGMVRTPLVDGLNFDEETLKADEKRYPLKRYGQPEDVAYGIVYLLSDASSWVTGTSLLINGGIHLV